MIWLKRRAYRIEQTVLSTGLLDTNEHRHRVGIRWHSPPADGPSWLTRIAESKPASGASTRSAANQCSCAETGRLSLLCRRMIPAWA